MNSYPPFVSYQPQSPCLAVHSATLCWSAAELMRSASLFGVSGSADPGQRLRLEDTRDFSQIRSEPMMLRTCAIPLFRVLILFSG